MKMQRSLLWRKRMKSNIRCQIKWLKTYKYLFLHFDAFVARKRLFEENYT